jgi:hypothetical protein
MRRILLVALLSVAGLASAPAEQQQPNASSTAQTSEATPEVIAALRERFPNVQGDKVNVRGDVVDFYTGHWHMTCSLTLNPVKLSKCHVVHA